MGKHRECMRCRETKRIDQFLTDKYNKAQRVCDDCHVGGLKCLHCGSDIKDGNFCRPLKGTQNCAKNYKGIKPTKVISDGEHWNTSENGMPEKCDGPERGQMCNDYNKCFGTYFTECTGYKPYKHKHKYSKGINTAKYAKG